MLVVKDNGCGLAVLHHEADGARHGEPEGVGKLGGEEFSLRFDYIDLSMVQFTRGEAPFARISFSKGASFMRTVEANYITSPSGRKKAIILPIREYERLLEDLHDLSVVAERRDESLVSLAEMKQRIKDHAEV